MRQSIEKYSTAFISIYENSVGFIADFDSLKIAQKAVDMIIEGLPHKDSDHFSSETESRKKRKRIPRNVETHI